MTTGPVDVMRERVERAVAAMGRLPARPGVSYRAAVDAPTDDLAAWAIGAVLADPGFFATSREALLAMAFGDIVLRVTGRSGRDIAALSQFPAEAEVVYLPGTTFTVTAVARETSTQRVLVDLAETSATGGPPFQPGGARSIADLPELAASESQRWQEEVRRSSARLGEITPSTVDLAKWTEPVGLRPVDAFPACRRRDLAGRRVRSSRPTSTATTAARPTRSAPSPPRDRLGCLVTGRRVTERPRRSRGRRSTAPVAGWPAWAAVLDPRVGGRQPGRATRRSATRPATSA